MECSDSSLGEAPLKSLCGLCVTSDCTFRAQKNSLAMSRPVPTPPTVVMRPGSMKE